MNRDPTFVPPEILIFFHIPKTGGTTVWGLLERCFAPQERFHIEAGGTECALWIRNTARIAEQSRSLREERRSAVRCMLGA